MNYKSMLSTIGLVAVLLIFSLATAAPAFAQGGGEEEIPAVIVDEADEPIRVLPESFDDLLVPGTVAAILWSLIGSALFRFGKELSVDHKRMVMWGLSIGSAVLIAVVNNLSPEQRAELEVIYEAMRPLLNLFWQGVLLSGAIYAGTQVFHRVKRLGQSRLSKSGWYLERPIQSNLNAQAVTETLREPIAKG